MREFLKSMREFLKSMREVFKVNARVFKVNARVFKVNAGSFKVNARSFKVSVRIDRQAHRSKSVSRQSGDWGISGVPFAYPWRTFRVSMAYLIVSNGDIVGNGSINFVTPLSPLFRIIDISHIPHCNGKNTDRSITPLS